MKTLITVAAVISITFYCYFLITVILTNQARQLVHFEQKGATPYHLFIVIPVLNEAGVIAHTISNLINTFTELPATITPHIIAINDNSDDDSLAILQTIDSSFLTIINRQAPTARQGKGAALNHAIKHIQKHYPTLDDTMTIIGILDADAIMTAADFTHLIADFEADPKLSMIQTAVAIYNQTNWLTRIQDFEFMSMNNSTQQLRTSLGQGIASGNGQFVTLRLAIENPWGNSLLEDLEFTLRAWLNGYQTAFTHNVIVHQEGITKLRPFIRQRIRWCQGGLDCLPYLPRLWRSHYVNLFQRVDTTLWVITPFLACVVPITNLIVLITQVGLYLTQAPQHWVSPALMLIMFLNVMICFVLAMQYQRNYAKVTRMPSFLAALWLSVSFQVYLIIMSIVPFIAIGRQLSGRHTWVKTTHSVVASKTN
ncbi:glycosyltransferase family 2 protein [Furfurilactobacillus curtus]|uniref:Glycosyl transferase family 2 n=1 Tax=Furfurilactobacillus curtus TaxID=1746200 RepID=A0ABQ5JQD3_9LACO